MIGRESAKALGILKITTDPEVNEISAKPNEFTKMKGIMVDIPMKDGIKPVAQPYRRVPVPLEKAVDEKIAPTRDNRKSDRTIAVDLTFSRGPTE